MPYSLKKKVDGEVVSTDEWATDHEMWVRCRKCPGCLRARRHLWQLRAEAEFIQADRTWFFTGTFRQQFHDLESVNEEVTRFLKRLRERTPDKLRYLLVPEEHKSGALHVHALLHCKESLTYRHVQKSWQAGWMDCKLANWKHPGYVTKYVTKSVSDATSSKRRPRIRASRCPTYGEVVIQRDAEILAEMMKDRPREDLQELWRKNLRMVVKEQAAKKGRAKVLEMLTS